MMFQRSDVTWRKASKSVFEGNCVEVGVAGDEVGIRDSKLGADSPVLTFDRAAFRAFVDDVKADRMEAARQG